MTATRKGPAFNLLAITAAPLLAPLFVAAIASPVCIGIGVVCGVCFSVHTCVARTCRSRCSRQRTGLDTSGTRTHRERARESLMTPSIDSVSLVKLCDWGGLTDRSIGGSDLDVARVKWMKSNVKRQHTHTPAVTKCRQVSRNGPLVFMITFCFLLFYRQYCLCPIHPHTHPIHPPHKSEIISSPHPPSQASPQSPSPTRRPLPAHARPALRR